MITGSEVDTDDRWAPDGNVRKRQCPLCLLSKDPMRQWIPFQDPYPIPPSVPYQALNEDGGCSREYSPENLNKVIAECNRNGMLVTYNHPVWSLESYPEYAPLKGLWGMEYRNSGSVAMGYDEKLARASAEAIVKGDMATVFANQKAHVDAREKALRAELLKETPPPAGGNPNSAMTIEDFRKMSPQERHDFSVANPEEYKKLYGGN